MRWSEFDKAVRAHFAEATGEALDLDNLVTSLVESEEDAEELEFSGPRDLLAERWNVERLLSFEWLGFPGWYASVDLLNTDQDYRLACWDMEEDHYYGFALLGPELDPQLYTDFASKLIAANGTEFGVMLFGGPPGRITNHMPDLVDREAIKRAFRKYIDWAVRNEQLYWADFRDQATRMGEELGFSETILRVATRLKESFGDPKITLDSTNAYLESRQAESDAMSHEEREAVFELYFKASYGEIRETRDPS